MIEVSEDLDEWADEQARHRLNPNNPAAAIADQIIVSRSPKVTALAALEQVWASYLYSLEEFNGKKPRVVLDDKRRKLIRRRLKDGYSVDDLCMAVTGWLYSDHHRGHNNRSTVYNSLDLLLRDGDHIDKFVAFHDRPGVAKSARQLDGEASGRQIDAALNNDHDLGSGTPWGELANP